MPKTPEANWGFLPDHPFVHKVSEAWDISQHTRLSDLVLAKHLNTHLTLYPDTTLANRAAWLFSLFPELDQLKSSEELLFRPFIWTDLVKEVNNLGTHEEARVYIDRQVYNGRKAAYWTGGLEFTQGQYQAARYLIGEGYQIVLGVEPFCFPDEFQKDRGPLSDHITAVTLWSKFLKEHGFVFNIPRPLPEYGKASPEKINYYYENLYQEITGSRAHIVVSESDPFKAVKQKRGPVVEVPYFRSPATTELFQSIFAD